LGPGTYDPDLFRELVFREVNNLNRLDLAEADLQWRDLRNVNFRKVNLFGATLQGANLQGADLSEAILVGAKLQRANLGEAILVGANLLGAHLTRTNLVKADLSRAILPDAELQRAEFREAILTEANLQGSAALRADLRWAILVGANLGAAYLRGANLRGADLSLTRLVQADLTDADLTGCRIYGISAWGLKLGEHTKQQNLTITPPGDPEITVDNIEVAQFVYLLLHNEKIRDAIDTIGKKGVLLLGRFTGGRIAILERLRDELRKRDFLPLVFNFDKPETKDFTETVRLLAGMSRFVIADITNPRSAPLELQATVPEYMIPFVPILERCEEPFAMFRDLWIKHRRWVLDPIRYPSVDRLIEVLDTEIIKPAQLRFAELLARKAEELRIKDV
jgi:uncharacterized protein YjbI with pentapeptide repeats